MGTDALLLVIAGALLHALWNLAAKQAAGGPVFVWLHGLVSVLVLLPFGMYAWITHPQQLSPGAWFAILASALVHVVYFLTLQTGYQRGDFSIVYPTARGTGPLFAVLGAIVVLGEMPSSLGWAGILAVLAGMVLLCWPAHGVGVSARIPAGVLWGCATGLCIALYTVIDGWAVKVSGIGPALYYFLGSMLRSLILSPHALRRPRALREQWRLHRLQILCVGILSPLAYILVLFAMTKAPLSYVAPIRELSMLLGIFLGARVLREALTPLRGLGTIAMVSGVILMVGAG